MRLREPLFLACLFASSAALPHHSPAAFDQGTITVVEGTVKEYRWGNPHTYLTLETAGPGGERRVQEIEAGPVSQLLPRGVTRELLKTGDRVTVRANPNRRGAGRIMLGVDLTKADGTSYPLHVRSLRALGPAEVAASSIAGTWVPRPEGFTGLLVAMQTWPVTDRARQEGVGNLARVMPTAAECTPAGPPFLMVNSVPINIAVSDRTVTFDIDWIGQVRRVVQLNARHPNGVRPSLLGHSIGHWDKSALVVDTVAFTAHPEGMGFTFPSSEGKHIVERFALSDDRKSLDYEIRIEDPAYLQAPVTYRTRWDYRPGQASSNAPCDKNVARRYLDE